MKFLTDEELKQSLSNPIFHLIGETADELQMECYVIGGFVRDLFLERPSNDIDCVVVGSGITIAKAVAEKIKEKFHMKPHIAVYANFGTAQIHFDGNEIEFVGARRESYSHDSRKPVVEDGTLEDDQNRRDFTINAMALCLNTNRFGELVDPFYGLEDLEDGIIRTPLDPDITFSDDPLRMMRCVRFATQLNFFIEDETFDALQRNAERIKIISGERISDEFNKIMLAKHPSKGIMDLERCGLLQLILPELVALEGVETMNGRGHKDNFYHTLAVLENVVKAQESENEELRTKDEKCLMEDDNVSNFQSSPSGDERETLWLRWAALLHDIGKPKSKRWDASNGWTFHNHDFYGQKMVPNIFRRMKLPLDERMKYVQKLVALHMRPIVIADEEVTDSAVRRLLSDAGDNIDDLMMLCEADMRLFQPVIDGDEIMQMFNLKPSREVGTLKQSLKDAILDGIIPNEPDAAHQFLIEKGKEMGLAPKE